MTGTGDYGYEMIQRSHLDDTSFEQLVAGRTVPGQELLVSFVEDVFPNSALGLAAKVGAATGSGRTRTKQPPTVPADPRIPPYTPPAPA